MSQDNLPEKISPEGVKVANKYLESSMSLEETSRLLNMERHEVSEILNQPHTKKYLNSVLSESGFRQMDKIERIMNEMIDKKLEELEEAEIGSSKDIADLLALASKMATEKMKILENREKEAKIVNQKNTQFNLYDSSSNYGKLMEAIATGKEI